jgi:hypothetical protein
MLDDALALKPSPSDWQRARARIANYRLGLYLGFGIIGAIVGACIGGVGYLIVR